MAVPSRGVAWMEHVGLRFRRACGADVPLMGEARQDHPLSPPLRGFKRRVSPRPLSQIESGLAGAKLSGPPHKQVKAGIPHCARLALTFFLVRCQFLPTRLAAIPPIVGMAKVVWKRAFSSVEKFNIP